MRRQRYRWQPLTYLLSPAVAAVGEKTFNLALVAVVALADLELTVPLLLLPKTTP